MTTTRCLSSRELSKPESVTHVLRQKCHPCPGLHTRAKNGDRRSGESRRRIETLTRVFEGVEGFGCSVDEGVPWGGRVLPAERAGRHQRRMRTWRWRSGDVARREFGAL